jgi:hypothetical protein
LQETSWGQTRLWLSSSQTNSLRLLEAHLSSVLFRCRGGPLFCQPEFPQLCGLCAYSMTRGEVIRRSLSALCGRLCGRLWLLHLLELSFGLGARFRMLCQDGLLSGAFTNASTEELVATAAGRSGRAAGAHHCHRRAYRASRNSASST